MVALPGTRLAIATTRQRNYELAVRLASALRSDLHDSVFPLCRQCVQCSSCWDSLREIDSMKLKSSDTDGHLVTCDNFHAKVVS